jgi:dienelactone hydrolase
MLMAAVLLFHHALGLTPGVIAFADALAAAGHSVHLPDLYDGQTFTALEDGIAYAEQVGFETIVARGARAAEALPSNLVYAGFSLGVMPAQQLAQTRPGALGALLVSACAPAGAFGAAWPAGLPIQVHAQANDPIFVNDGDLDAARALAVGHDRAELFLYPGTAHLFAERGRDDYDETATGLLVARSLHFLRTVDPR